MYSVQSKRQRTTRRAIGLLLAGMFAADVNAQAANGAFTYEERSTMHTIPFESLDQSALSETIIEGGLAAPAAGIPARPVTQPDEDYYLDPLAFQPRDDRTDLGRYEIPVEIRFSNPKSVPGQTFGNNYVIRPPENRTYDTLNANLRDR
ncbi:hypothetical protein [Marinobacter fonticola]|uniref:hypothetical protein n=1 Tax=Marinobacter fonticola TaxID=2603215 RepID=UPI001D0D9B79|nr:hypothetical protein [Marinobacter fonticola]